MSKLLSSINKKFRAQAMVEFALVLPVLLMLIYGLMETGRLLFIYASTVTAARQAVRYGSATGLTNPSDPNSLPYYKDCDGIINSANKLAFIQSFESVSIQYDGGVSPADGSPIPLSPDPNATCATIPYVENGDRILVEVVSQYQPIVPLVPLEPLTIRSSSERTILVGVDVQVAMPIPAFGGTGGMPFLSLTASPSQFDHVGQEITFTFTITNVGDTVLNGPFNVNDDLDVILSACLSSSPPMLMPGDSYACEGTYLVTQADLDRGYVTNGATSTPTGTTTVGSVTVNALQSASMSFDKRSSVPATTVSVTYTYVLTNTGNVTLVNYKITDDKLGDICSGASIAPQASITCTNLHQITDTEIGAGSLVNVGTATATYGNGKPIVANDTVKVITTPIYLSIVSTLTKGVSPYRPPGQTITYNFSVQNNSGGAVTLNGVTITSFTGSTPLTVTCTGMIAVATSLPCGPITYTVTQTDLDNLSGNTGIPITLTATAASAEGYSSNATNSLDVYRYPDAAITATTSFVDLTGALVSPAVATLANPINVGAFIDYAYVLENKGNVSMTLPAYFEVKDSAITTGITCDLSPSATLTGTSPNQKLLPGGKITCVAEREIFQEDVDNGSVLGQVTSALTFGSTLYSVKTESLVVIATDPKIKLKITSPTQSVVGKGATINYLYTLTNIGNATLTGLDFSGQVGSIPACPDTTLAVGKSMECTGTHKTTATDYSAKQVVNSPTVSAVSSLGMVSATDTLIVYVVAPTYCNINHGPLIIPPAGPLGMTIINNNEFPVDIKSVRIIYNDVPASQQINKIDLGSNQLWSQNNVPMSGDYTFTSFNGDPTVPGLSTTMLAVTKWNSETLLPYQAYIPASPSIERIIISFVPLDPADPTNVCPDLDSGVIITPPAADLAITKSNGVSTLDIGSSTTYTVRVTNNSGASISGAKLSDPVASGLSITSVTCSTLAGNKCVSPPSVAQLQSGTFKLPNLDVGNKYEVLVKANVTATGGSITNYATVAMPIGSTDPNEANNTTYPADTDTIVSPYADLSITKTANFPTLPTSANVIYTITVVNNDPVGGSTIIGAKLKDLAVTGMNKTLIVCAPVANNACGTPPTKTNLESASGALLPSLAPGAVYTLLITANITALGSDDPVNHPVTLNNTATIIPPTGSDPNTGNNNSTVPINVVNAGLAVTKTTSATGASIGGTITYNIHVSNTYGPVDISGATLKDTPDGVDFTGVGASITCSTTVANNVCSSAPSSASLQNGFTLPTIPVGKNYDITIVASVNAMLTDSDGKVKNKADITVPGTYADAASDNSSEVETPLRIGDLRIVKSSTQTNYSSNSDIATYTLYTVEVENKGIIDISGARLFDTKPTQITSWTWTCTPPSGGSCPGVTSSTANFDQNITVPAGGKITYTVKANTMTNPSGLLDNYATVTMPSGYKDIKGNDTTTSNTVRLYPSCAANTNWTVGNITYLSKSSKDYLDMIVTNNMGVSLSISSVKITWTPVVTQGGSSKDWILNSLGVTTSTTPASSLTATGFPDTDGSYTSGSGTLQTGATTFSFGFSRSSPTGVTVNITFETNYDTVCHITKTYP